MDHEFVKLFGIVYLIDTATERATARRMMRKQRVAELRIWIESESGESIPTEEKFTTRKAGTHDR